MFAIMYNKNIKKRGKQNENGKRSKKFKYD